MKASTHSAMCCTLYTTYGSTVNTIERELMCPGWMGVYCKQYGRPWSTSFERFEVISLFSPAVLKSYSHESQWRIFPWGKWRRHEWDSATNTECKSEWYYSQAPPVQIILPQGGSFDWPWKELVVDSRNMGKCIPYPWRCYFRGEGWFY